MIIWLMDLVQRFEIDRQLDEILINGTTSLVEVRGTENLILKAPFTDPSKFERSIQDFSFDKGHRLDPLKPFAGGIFFDEKSGFNLRWHGILRAICPKGPLFSLRRHRFNEIGLVAFGGWKRQYREILEENIKTNQPIIVMGETGSGKTTFLSSLLCEYCSDERVIILEKYSEIVLRSSSWVGLNPAEGNRDGKGLVSFSLLFAEALRMRPDRIVLGEARGKEEGEALFHCLSTGHGGLISSVHVDNLKHSLNRLMQIMGKDCKELLAARNPLLIMMERGFPPRILKMTDLSSIRNMPPRKKNIYSDSPQNFGNLPE